MTRGISTILKIGFAAGNNLLGESQAGSRKSMQMWGDIPSA